MGMVSDDEFNRLLDSVLKMSELNNEQFKLIRELQAQVRDLTQIVEAHESEIAELRSEIVDMCIDKL